MNGNTWENLVVETQFATELTLTGLRRLCAVPTDPRLVQWGSNDLNYALHVGMYAYSSGLERLCKLALACNRYASEGSFPNLRKYNHKIGSLLDAVEDLTPTGPATSTRVAQHLKRPQDALDPHLTDTVERFANGAGRYEHLDSLWNDSAKVNTYNEWVSLASRASVSKEVRRLISLRDAMTDVLGSEIVHSGLEATGERVMEDLSLPTYEPSVGVVLSLFRKVRWVSTILDVATYYTSPDLPILGEVVSPIFIHPSTDFFKFSVARIGDEEVVAEEVQDAYGRIRAREAEEDESISLWIDE